MMYWFFDLSEDIATEVLDRIYDAHDAGRSRQAVHRQACDPRV
jgi:hypothetical protein